MPKIKTNRMAHKKFRVNAKGKAKSYRARTSHNTGKKSAKTSRQLRGSKMVDASFARTVARQLPYSKTAN